VTESPALVWQRHHPVLSLAFLFWR
jgi:hypothetical protein